MSALLWAIAFSVAPIGELRAGIPIALAGGVNPWVAYFACVIANIIVVPITYFFLEVIHRRVMHIGIYQSTFDKFMERTRRKTQKYVEKYGLFGIFILTAIPFPGTGAYTATFAAWFFGINRFKTFLSVAAGVMVAGAIVAGLFGVINSLIA